MHSVFRSDFLHFKKYYLIFRKSGKLITSVTMTVFYVILYFILEGVWQPDQKTKTASRISLYVLTALRIILCAFPQNEWFKYESSLLWGILRNIPFALIGITVIAICFIIDRVEGIFSPLPHHRTCRSAYGGSVLYLVLLQRFCS